MSLLIKRTDTNQYLSGFLEHSCRWCDNPDTAKTFTQNEELYLIREGLKNIYNIDTKTVEKHIERENFRRKL